MSAKVVRPGPGAPSDPAEALAFLRARFTGDLFMEEERKPVRFVLDNQTGALVANVTNDALEAESLVLHVPEETDGAMQLLLSATKIDGATHASADRWRIHHGEAREAHWALFTIEGGRFAGAVLDGEALMKPNALGALEPALCKRLNADKGALRRALAGAGHDVEAPVCVGVDAWGLSVRARFAIVRVGFDGAPVSPEAAGKQVEALLARAGATT